MSFAFSVGDILAVGKLVLNTYNAYKEAPDQFRSISQELHSLHIIVKRVEHQVQGQGQSTMDPGQQVELKVILAGLQDVLTGLDKLLKDYYDLGSRAGFSFDRLAWGKKDIAGLRERVVSNTTLLTAFYASLTNCQIAAMQGQLGAMQGQLGQLLTLRRKGSSASFTGSIASDALSLRSKVAWKDLHRGLRSNDITVPMLQNKLPEILNLFRSTTVTDAGSNTDVTKALQEKRKTGRESNFALKSLGMITGRLLRSALERNDVEAVRPWSTLVSDIDQRGEGGKTALHYAACENRVECLQLLLEKGATIDARDDDGWTPLYCAARWSKVECLQLLVEKGATIDAKTNAGWTPLHRTAHWGKVECLQLLLEKGATIDAKTDKGSTPVHFASARNHGVKCLRVLLEKGAPIEIKTDVGWTPLHCAARWGNVGCLQLLLEKGATADAKTNDGSTPLHCAARWGKVECLQLLLVKGATIDVKADDGSTPLHCAARWGNVGCLQLLLEKGGNIDIPDVLGNSVLHFSILHGQSWNPYPQNEMSQIINTLLDHGADIFQQNNEGKTPLDLASKLPKKFSWIADRLYEHVYTSTLRSQPKGTES